MFVRSSVYALMKNREAICNQHLSVPEIAKRLNLSGDAIRKLFQNEPGVLKLNSQKAANKRRYVTLRIPVSVFERVYRRLLS
jgi:hypothetical protein